MWTTLIDSQKYILLVEAFYMNSIGLVGVSDFTWHKYFSQASLVYAGTFLKSVLMRIIYM